MGVPLSKDATLKPGTILQDNTPRGKGRQVRLIETFNPLGKLVGPWWRVENVVTKRKTLIRQDRFLDTPRWSFAVEINEEGKRA
jgi:hypothetical protein